MSVQSINPATGEVLETFEETAPDALAQILERADAASREWRRRPVGERAERLRAAGRLYAAGERDSRLLRDTARARLAMDPDYLELRRRDDLGAYDPDLPAILLVAARLGTTRLIDNLSLEDA